jgi:outer membrane protein W
MLKKIVIRYAVTLFVFAVFISGASAFGGDREGRWDLYIPINYISSTSLEGPNGSSVDINGDLGFGLGFGYYLTDNFQLGGLFTYASSNYSAKVVLEDYSIKKYSNRLDSSTIAMTGTYYFLKGNFTPFVNGSVGYTFVDTNITTGPPSGSCWWDPWWGWVCSSSVPTKTESEFNYGAGVGMRFDLNQHFGFKFSYNKSWFDIGSLSGTPDFDVWQLGFLIRY